MEPDDAPPASAGAPPAPPAALPRARPEGSLRRWGPLLALVALAFAAHANTLGHGFVYDDRIVLANPMRERPFDLGALLANGFFEALRGDVLVYRPLAAASFLWNGWLAERLTGRFDHAFLFHLVNVLLHASATGAFWGWLRALGASRWTAAAAAALFAVHPVHVESVANVWGRADPQAVLLGLLALAAHARGRTALGAAVFALALLSKESAAGFLPVLIAADLLRPARVTRRLAAGWVAWGAVLALWLALRAWALAGWPSPEPYIENPLLGADLATRVATVAAVQLEYLRLLAWPVRLSTDYSFAQVAPVASLAEPRALAGALLLLAGAASAWLLRRSRPLHALGVMTYLALFATTANLLVLIGVLMAERLAYAPSLGFALAVALAFEAAARRLGRAPVAAVVAAVVSALAARTWIQNRVWRDEATLFAEQVRTAPRSAKAHFNRGFQLLATDPAEALVHARRAVEIYPGSAQAWNLVGIACQRTRADPEVAIAAWSEALRIAPGHPDARSNLALMLALAGRLDEARAQARELYRRYPNHPSLPRLNQALAPR